MRPLTLALLASALSSATVFAEQLVLPPPSLSGCHRALTALEKRADKGPSSPADGLSLDFVLDRKPAGMILVRDKEGTASFTPFGDRAPDGPLSFSVRQNGGPPLIMNFLFERGRYARGTFGTKMIPEGTFLPASERYTEDTLRSYLTLRLASAAELYKAGSDKARQKAWSDDYPDVSACLEEALGATVVLCRGLDATAPDPTEELKATYCGRYICAHGMPPFMRFDAKRCGS
jgi:hypothetical protein